MKKYILFACTLLTLGFFASCSSCSNKNEKPREERVAEFRAGQVDRVLSSLYEYDDSTKEVKPLSKQTADRFRRRFHMFPVLDYSRQFFSFQLEGCNDVRYNVTWAKAEQTGTGEPAKTAYMFNPVKVDGTWKLCVKTQKDEIDPDMR